MRLLLLASLPVALLSACGFPSPDSIGEQIAQEILQDIPRHVQALEGSLVNDQSADPLAALRVGDDEDDRFWRAFVIYELPDARGRTLDKARLRLDQASIVGLPYDKLGLLFAERVDIGSSLDASDFGATPHARTIGINDDTIGALEIDVTTLVQDALDAGATRLDVRLRFGAEVSFDSIADHTTFTEHRLIVALPSFAPVLYVDWHPAP